MKRNQRNEWILETLCQSYDAEQGSLDFTTPFELLVAVMLSAQCTDARVNMVTKDLFAYCNTPEGFVKMDLADLENRISSISFFHNKAKHIKECSLQLVEQFHGQVPQTMEELTSLSGIGRKSANVILLEAFHNCQGIAVDTHALRLSNRLGFSKETDPLKVEQDLLRIFPKQYWPLMNHLLVYHGRAICKAQKPLCNQCPVASHCPSCNSKPSKKRYRRLTIPFLIFIFWI